MKIEQKVISFTVSCSAQNLTDELQTLAADGWRIQRVSAITTRKGGAIYVIGDAYYEDTFYLVMEKTGKTRSYDCAIHKRIRNKMDDSEALNVLIAQQNQQDYRLLHLLPCTSISANDDRPTRGTVAYLLIFEKSTGSSGGKQ